MVTLFGVLLGSGGLVSQGSAGSTSFTLSLPVSRRQLLGVRAATGLGELFLLALVPSLVIPALSPAVGETYSIVSALIHAVCLFVVGGVFFCLALFLSTVFSDVWRPLLAAVCAAIGLSLLEQAVGRPFRFGFFTAMSGETYFRTGSLPWAGLLISVVASAALLYGAITSLERQDF
jgi:ABC-type transport system involved in multi-copper enzyme maturation permease subunit